MVAEKGSQRYILILSAAIPGRYGLYSSFKCSASRGERLICFSPVIAFDSPARGPPFSIWAKSVQKDRVFFLGLRLMNSQSYF